MNLFNYIPPRVGEDFYTLFEYKNIKIVRIVSSEEIDTKLYNQKEDEWVVLLKGEAILELDGKKRDLKVGESLFIPANTPHRVLATESGTLWIAIHIF